MSEQNTRLGIMMMVATTFVFAVQDGISRHLAGEYNVLMVVMIRYWFFAAFVIAIAARQAGGVRAAAKTEQPAPKGSETPASKKAETSSTPAPVRRDERQR